MKVVGAKPPEPGKAIRVTAEGATVAVFNVGGRLYGVDAKCTHMGGPLERGAVADSTVTCPWHGSQFNVTTGAVLRGPATQPLRSYRVDAEADGLVITAVPGTGSPGPAPGRR
jgi:nitrite reductase/ring-hydroxylating ferredoxin subunit